MWKIFLMWLASSAFFFTWKHKSWFRICSYFSEFSNLWIYWFFSLICSRNWISDWFLYSICSFSCFRELSLFKIWASSAIPVLLNSSFLT